jgi:hypothetical protein
MQPSTRPHRHTQPRAEPFVSLSVSLTVSGSCSCQALLEGTLEIDTMGGLVKPAMPEDPEAYMQAKAKQEEAKANVAKRAVKKSRYTTYRKQGAGVMARAYGITAFQVGARSLSVTLRASWVTLRARWEAFCRAG